MRIQSTRKWHTQNSALTLAVVLSTICASSRQIRQNTTPVSGLGNAMYRLSYRMDLPALFPTKEKKS